MSESNVVLFNGITKLDLPAGMVLEKALAAGLTEVVIMGHTADGDEYFASSVGDGGTVLWLMERMKMALLAVPDEL